MFKKLKKWVFPTRHFLKQIDREIRELKKVAEAGVALQRKRDIQGTVRFRNHLAALADPDLAGGSDISPSFQFAADDLRPVLLRPETAKTVICTVALGDSYRAAVAPCLESQRAYAQRAGMAYADLMAPPSRLLRHPSWYKLPLAQHLLSLGYERIAFLDADVLITQPDQSMTEFFARLENSGRDVLVSNDESGLNMGVFFARSTPSLPLLLDLIWNYCFDPNHITWEQIAVRTLADEQPAVQRRILIADRARDFNSFPAERAQIHKLHHQASTWQPGDFACHFSGIGAPRLQELISSYQQRAENSGSV
jgi:hypothetical protein